MPVIGRVTLQYSTFSSACTNAGLGGLDRGLRLLDLSGLVDLGGIQRGLAALDIGLGALLGGQCVVVVLLRHGALFGQGFEPLDILVGLVQACHRDPQVGLRGGDDRLFLRLRQVGLGLRQLRLGLHQLGFIFAVVES